MLALIKLDKTIKASHTGSVPTTCHGRNFMADLGIIGFGAIGQFGADGPWHRDADFDSYVRTGLSGCGSGGVILSRNCLSRRLRSMHASRIDAVYPGYIALIR
jgi:hypothetical protein